jgi:hypothetical protein
MPSRTQIYQIKITLQGSDPPIWRRIQVRGDTPLDKLHDIIIRRMDILWNPPCCFSSPATLCSKLSPLPRSCSKKRAPWLSFGFQRSISPKPVCASRTRFSRHRHSALPCSAHLGGREPMQDAATLFTRPLYPMPEMHQQQSRDAREGNRQDDSKALDGV